MSLPVWAIVLICLIVFCFVFIFGYISSVRNSDQNFRGQNDSDYYYG